MKTINYALIIRDSLKTEHVLQTYGIEFNHAGFAICPFHQEKTASLKVYSDRWYCFGCHKNGDSIQFVIDYFNLEWHDAIEKINNDFALNLPLGRKQTLGESMMASKRIKQIQTEREQKRKFIESAEAVYNETLDEYTRLDYNYIHFKPPVPSPPDIELHPLFIEALQKLEFYKYLVKITPLPERG